MRSFTCDGCGQLVFFENSLCVACQTPLGYSPSAARIVGLAGGPERDGGPSKEPTDEKRCALFEMAGCNWLVPADAPHQALCRSCELTRTRPADDDLEGMTAYRRTEAAKRRLVFQLDELGLPIVPRSRDPERGLTFELLSSRAQPVTTGHADGTITLDLAEGHDPHREAMRLQMGEPYRTLLGHLRHEIGHYYWQQLVSGSRWLDRFREQFGDERADYAAALQRHYDEGAPPDWNDRHVSAYATAHPWEDWAETFAHYLHIRDALQTAAAYGLVVEGPRPAGRSTPEGDESEPDELDGGEGDEKLAEALSADPREAASTIDELVAMWIALTYALNAMNRSMGKDDVYPFVLAAPTIAKLGLVHRVIRAAARARRRAASSGEAASRPRGER